MSLKQEGIQMAYYFRKINMLKTSEKSERQDYLFNLDKFHTIFRDDNEIIAEGDVNSRVVIAVCQTSSGAKYVLDCIEREKDINYHHLNLREREQ